MTTNNESNFGIVTNASAAHWGNSYFQFSSYNVSSDYNQYLITPRLDLTKTAILEYYYKDISGHGRETFTIMISTTDNEMSSFTTVSNTITATDSWLRGVCEIPANAKYVAFHYTSEYEYKMGLDDISIIYMRETPEVSLQQVLLPEMMLGGDDFVVQGVVKNNSAEVLNSFEVEIEIDETVLNNTITGMSVPSGDTYTFTYPTPINLPGGTHDMRIMIKNPNGYMDDESDNALEVTIYVCGDIEEFPYVQDFEQGMWCWKALAATTDNSFGIISSYSHSTSHSFRFSSWSNSSDYSQYLISPRMTLTEPVRLSFCAKDIYGYGGETIQVMYSVTDDDIDSFINLGEEINVTDYWNLYVRLVPASAKYVMIKYTTQGRYDTCIDDISLEEVGVAPEVELTNVRAPYMVGNSVPFNLSATITNSSSTDIESLNVLCKVDGELYSTDVVTGIVARYNEPFTFTIPTAFTIDNIGSRTITVTVQEPNGVADDLADNTKNVVVVVYNTEGTVHRKVLMENFSTASCPNCYDGHEYINGILSQGYENDIIWVTHHAGYHTDRLTIPEDNTFTGFYNDNGNTYTPAIMLDRTYFGDFQFTHALGVPEGSVFFLGNGLDEGFATVTSIPANVTVVIDNLNYNRDARQLSVTVSGDVLSDLDATDPRLNVWLVEDGIIADGETLPGHGPTQPYAPSDFTHDGVVRVVLSQSAWGDEGEVSSEAGSSYSRTYTCSLPEQYVDSMCYIVAFVSEGNHSNYNNCKVYNAEKSHFITENMRSMSIVYTHDGLQLRQGDTIVQTSDVYEMADMYFGYENVSRSNISVRVKKENVAMAPGAESTFCIGNTCISGTLSMIISLASGEQIAENHGSALHTSYMATEPGTSLVKYSMFNVDDTTDATYFYIRYVMPTSTDSDFADGVVSVYPNPAHTYVEISGINEYPCGYTIYSMVGRSVLEGETSGRIMLDVLMPGEYILELRKPQGDRQYKIIIE